MKHEVNHIVYSSEGERRAKKIYARVSSLFLALVLTTVPALAVNDPLAAVNNLSDFIFSLIRHLAGGPVSQEPRPLPACQRDAHRSWRYRYYLH